MEKSVPDVAPTFNKSFILTRTNWKVYKIMQKFFAVTFFNKENDCC